MILAKNRVKFADMGGLGRIILSAQAECRTCSTKIILFASLKAIFGGNAFADKFMRPVFLKNL